MRKQLGCLILLACAVTATGQDVAGSCSVEAEQKASTAPKPPGTFDIGALDKTVDPCVDFYQFACGGWRKANPIPADQTRWGRFNELAERNREALHEILEQVKDPADRRSPIESKVGDYYAACMDESGIEKQGTKPIESFLARVAAVDSKAALFRLLGEHEAQALPALFRFGAAPNLHDSRETIANVGQGGLGLPDREDYLKDDPKSKEKREKYLEHVTRMLTLIGEGADQAKASAQTVLRIETELASAHLSRVDMRDPKNRDNPMTVGDLQKLAPAFEWREYFAASGAPSFSNLNVSSKKYFAEFNPLVEKTPIADWKTYLKWHLVNATAPYLGAAFVQEDFRFNRAYLQGAKEMEPRWKRCVQATDRALGDALGQLYVEKTFGSEGKLRMRSMIEAITAALREDIEGLPWMTPETKAKALTKLAAFNAHKVGYPEKWKDYASVAVRRDDYFGNSRRARVFEIKRDHARIDKPTDRTLWGMTPPTVNAYYNAANNEIVFPAGILQPPFFDRAIDDAVNFGGIGVVIGHEYTHGFDDQGSKFDAQGNLENWWSADDLKAFGERTECVAKEYDGFVSVKDATSGDVHLNGKLTLGENTADNGGLRVAYMALQKALAGKTRAQIDGYTPEQRFFLGFANVWCQNVTEQAARQLAQTDSHSPGEFRTNGSVSNMPEFWQAFGCKAGQPMVRANACRVW
ncbi:MAG TPA: M13 family metallopeptidase [Vicinamibacteria bacterium]|nr:M13 family metallopeptidase [Vicinamibacteria bacterium]